MKKIRELLAKINDAIRPPHVGPLPRTDITALGGPMDSNRAADLARADAHQAAAESVQGMGNP